MLADAHTPVHGSCAPKHLLEEPAHIHAAAFHEGRVEIFGVGMPIAPVLREVAHASQKHPGTHQAAQGAQSHRRARITIRPITHTIAVAECNGLDGVGGGIGQITGAIPLHGIGILFNKSQVRLIAPPVHKGGRGKGLEGRQFARQPPTPTQQDVPKVPAIGQSSGTQTPDRKRRVSSRRALVPVDPTEHLRVGVAVEALVKPGSLVLVVAHQPIPKLMTGLVHGDTFRLVHLLAGEHACAAGEEGWVLHPSRCGGSPSGIHHRDFAIGVLAPPKPIEKQGCRRGLCVALTLVRVFGLQ